jgi:glycosyltransferase involved in cell wall biosynthesis
MVFGWEEGLRPNRFFEPEYYINEYDVENGSDWKAFEHYKAFEHFARVFKGNYQCRKVAELPSRPLISILTPVYNSDELLLRKCIHSVLYQAYRHWELCLVDDGSSEVHIRKILEEYTGLDSRIKARFLKENKGISAASNEAAAMATGDFLGFLDHDDELTLDALYEVTKVINAENPDIIYTDEDLVNHPDIIYTDEDLVNRDSHFLDPFYKPGYNQELLLCHNYITHFLVTRRSCFVETGGFSDEYSGAQDYDLCLKLVEKNRKTIHIPRILYHWRAHATSTSVNHEQKLYANEAGRKALADALIRREIAGTAENTELNFFYRARKKLVDKPQISVICSDLNGSKRTAACVKILIQSTTYSNIEFILPGEKESDSSSPERLSAGNINIRLVNCSKEMTEPQWKNRAVGEAEGKILVFFDLALQVEDEHWLESMLEHAQQDEIGFAGGRINYTDDDFQHRGTVPEIYNRSWYYYVSFVRDVSIHLNGMHCPQHVQYVPESLCMIQRHKFTDLGGFEETYATSAFASLDLCLRLSEQPLAHVFTPHCKMRGSGHYLRQRVESIDLNDAARDKEMFQRKWFTRLMEGDPYYNRSVLSDKKISEDAFLKWYAGDFQDFNVDEPPS